MYRLKDVDHVCKLYGVYEDAENLYIVEVSQSYVNDD